MVIIELKNGKPEVTGGPVTSFDRYKVSEYLGVDRDGCCIVNFQGAPSWCRCSELEEIQKWYPGKIKDARVRDKTLTLAKVFADEILEKGIEREVVELLVPHLTQNDKR